MRRGDPGVGAAERHVGVRTTWRGGVAHGAVAVVNKTRRLSMSDEDEDRTFLGTDSRCCSCCFTLLTVTVVHKPTNKTVSHGLDDSHSQQEAEINTNSLSLNLCVCGREQGRRRWCWWRGSLTRKMEVKVFRKSSRESRRTHESFFVEPRVRARGLPPRPSPVSEICHHTAANSMRGYLSPRHDDHHQLIIVVRPIFVPTRHLRHDRSSSQSS